MPPSLLAGALVLQTYARVSDREAKERADFDLRWKVALGVGLDERPFAKSTLQLFRAQLVVHERAQAGGGGRTVSLHPEEALLQEARALERSPEMREHRLARLVQLGIRQARYLGRTKALVQLLLAAMVANLTLIAGAEHVAAADQPPMPAAA